jgi:hypothetical protein
MKVFSTAKKSGVNECDTERQFDDFERLQQHLEFEEPDQLNVLLSTSFQFL